jgi:hypothetical protein
MEQVLTQLPLVSVCDRPPFLVPLFSSGDQSDASQEPAFESGDDGDILGIAMGTVWEGNSDDCSILPETQRHELRAQVAEPEVFHIGGAAGIRVDGRDQFGVVFQSKKSSVLEITKRCGT